ncbi:hypothetical protein [Brazilian porcupinepox virus 1]|nr:hypothetical protein [Brazilian porcupinepox virus 1]
MEYFNYFLVVSLLYLSNAFYDNDFTYRKTYIDGVDTITYTNINYSIEVKVKENEHKITDTVLYKKGDCKKINVSDEHVLVYVYFDNFLIIKKNVTNDDIGCYNCIYTSYDYYTVNGSMCIDINNDNTTIYRSPCIRFSFTYNVTNDDNKPLNLNVNSMSYLSPSYCIVLLTCFIVLLL